MLRGSQKPLSTTHPSLLSEWHPTRNLPLTPEDVVAGTSLKIWWQCHKREVHVWQASGDSRARGNGCPICANKKVLSGENDLATRFPEIATQWSNKNEKRASEVMPGSPEKAWWTCNQSHEWYAAISSRTNPYLNAGCPYCANKAVWPGWNDLATLNPDVAALWNHQKNTLSPQEVVPGTPRKVWWKCEHGHEWQKPVNAQCQQGTCPACIGKALIPNANDLLSMNPAVAAQWHPHKNGEVKPSGVIYNKSKVQYWWLCELGHETQTTMAVRSQHACAQCASTSFNYLTNNLVSASSPLQNEWHFEKNELGPQYFSPSSNKKVWWRCSRGHEWKATVTSRANFKTGCPYCSGRLPIPGETDLATTNPTLAIQLHPTLNGEMTASRLKNTSRTPVWWLCASGHAWKATVAARQEGDCPYCGNRALLLGFNDVATKFPELVPEWSVDKNDGLTPDNALASTTRRYWWVCKEGHPVHTSATQRSKHSCFYCTNHKLWVGFNDLQTLLPEVAEEWHPNRNGELKPYEVKAGSSKRVWWRCALGHEWQTAIIYRKKSGCPSCAKYGFGASDRAILYFLSNSKLSAFKLGITGVDTDRLAYFTSRGWSLIQSWEFPVGADARKLEVLLFKWIRDELGLGFAVEQSVMGRRGGHTETFPINLVAQEQVIERAEALIRLLP